MKDRSDGERREVTDGCDNVVGDAERPCGHTKESHHRRDGCMWCDCWGFR